MATERDAASPLSVKNERNTSPSELSAFAVAAEATDYATSFVLDPSAALRARPDEELVEGVLVLSSLGTGPEMLPQGLSEGIRARCHLGRPKAGR